MATAAVCRPPDTDPCAADDAAQDNPRFLRFDRSFPRLPWWRREGLRFVARIESRVVEVIYRQIPPHVKDVAIHALTAMLRDELHLSRGHDLAG